MAALPVIAPGASLSEQAGWELIQQAEALLDAPTDADSAEDFYRRVAAVEDAMHWARLSTAVCVAMGRVRLRAERRWGELLGPAAIGRPAGNVSATDVSDSAEREARRQARKVAEVPAEAFDAYVTAEREDPPTRAGVLRIASKLEAPEAPEEPEEPEEPDRSTIKVRELFVNPLGHALSAASMALDGFPAAMATKPPQSELRAWLTEAEETRRHISSICNRLNRRLGTNAT
jgi:hypothetical protein